MTLGIDIGGTTISLGLVDASEVVKKVSVPSFLPDATQAQTLEYLGNRIAGILTPEVEKIGVGVPSLTDPVKGIVYNAANIPSWDVVPLKETLEKRFGLPVSVNNDANCYALGAARALGCNQGTAVTVTLGTGTGVGIVIDGRLFNGTHCGAGEIGSAPYLEADYESYCSKKFFISRGVEPYHLSQAAEKGDESALALFREFGQHLGKFLALVMYAYDADHLVLGGGVARGHRFFEAAMRESLENNYPYQNTLEDLQIHFLTDDNLALIGAASL